MVFLEQLLKDSISSPVGRLNWNLLIVVIVLTFVVLILMAIMSIGTQPRIVPGPFASREPMYDEDADKPPPCTFVPFTEPHFHMTIGTTADDYIPLSRLQGKECAHCGQPATTATLQIIDGEFPKGTVRGLACDRCAIAYSRKPLPPDPQTLS